MRIDNLTTGSVDRSRPTQVQYKMVRGELTALLITNSTTFHWKDQITVKLRHSGGLLTVVDRVSAFLLATLTDLKQGMPTTGTPNYVGTADGEDNDDGGYVQINQGVKFFQNAILLPLGHITLTGKEELEIIVESAQQTVFDPTINGGVAPTGVVKISSVKNKSRVDTILCYDQSADLEATQSSVREIYLVGVNNVSFFKNAVAGAIYGVPQCADITVKLGVDGDDSENDLESYAAMTAITGQLSYQPSGLIRVFQDLESLPASVYIKVFGSDKAGAEILYIRETTVPHMVGQSILKGVDTEQKRIEVLEANEPDKARALQQAGVIAASADLAKAKDNFVPAVATPTK